MSLHTYIYINMSHYIFIYVTLYIYQIISKVPLEFPGDEDGIITAYLEEGIGHIQRPC